MNKSHFTQIDTAIITAKTPGAESNIIRIKNLHIVATRTSPSASPPRASPVAENGCKEKNLYSDGKTTRLITLYEVADANTQKLVKALRYFK